MPAAERRKGHQFERDVAKWLRSRGVNAHSSRELSGGLQQGSDIISDLPVTVECKNHKAMDLAGWVDQAVNDAAGDPASVWVKRRGKTDVGEAYVVMRAGDFVALVDDLSTRPLSDADVEF